MGVFIALPIYYSIINAFKPVSELFLFPPRFVVYHPTFENFKNIIRLQSQSTIAVERYIFNSVTVTVIATAGYILIASLAAYPMAKKEFPGKKIISVVIVFAILFSADVTELPRYMMMSKFGMLDTYWAILLPAMAGSFGVFLMIQFMSGIPNDILEAANIDGSNEIQTFFYIIMPSVKPALFTLTIFTFIATWPLSGSQFTYSVIFTDLCVAGENAMQYSVKNNLSYLEARSKKVEYIKKAIMDKISLFGSREKV